MSKIQRVTGMQDVLSEDRRYWDWVETAVSDFSHHYGFQRFDVPVIEYTNLFARGMGTASDVFVQKEMYTLKESDGTLITLRPEFTAGIARAYVKNGMASLPQPIKLFTMGPIFRRERPQAGRYRQHSQFDCEILGTTDPAADLEVMMLAVNLLRSLGYKNPAFQLNSTGCPVCKPAYIDRLTAYLAEHADELADIDKERLQKNPLRVLDSKEKGMEKLLAEAPHIIDYLCEDCETHFADLRSYLDALDQSYSINFRLVRGIDYYTKTVFEVWAEGIGAQSALFGGGRYDGLIEAVGGRSTPGVGFGMGIERIILGLKEQGIEAPEMPSPSVMIAHFGGKTKETAVQLTYRLRAAGIATRLAFARERRGLRSQMREANKNNIQTVVLVGEDELAEGKVTIRPLDGSEQTQISLSDVEEYFVRERI